MPPASCEGGYSPKEAAILPELMSQRNHVPPPRVLPLLREVQQKRHGGQWFKGKSLDGHGPMKPWIVTAAGVKLDDVRVICRVNGVDIGKTTRLSI